MLDAGDLELYCLSGVWTAAGLSCREWVQCNDRRHQKNKTVNEGQEKKKQSRKTWMLSRMGSTIKQKTLSRRTGCELHKKGSNKNEVEQTCEDITHLPIPILPQSGILEREDRVTFPCGTFTELQSAEFFHSPVIIKREKPSGLNGSVALKRELCVLTQIHHPNILLLMGAVKLDLNQILTIFENANNGTLHYLLHEKKVSMYPMEIQKLLTQLCHVMMFLHERGWLHNAINSHNILISENTTLKLTGFEMAREVHQEQDDISNTTPLRNQWFQWQSPEQLKEETRIYTESDVFSAGLVSWEMCTNAEPWSGYKLDELLFKYKSLKCTIGADGLPSPFKNPKVNSFHSCLKNMLQVDPKRRISSFSEVLSHIHQQQSICISTTNSVSDYIQPLHLKGSLTRAQLRLQPQVQKATMTNSKQSDQHDWDPYTGLKRVSSSWNKLHTKSNSAASLNVGSFTTSTRGNEISSSYMLRKLSLNKSQLKQEFLLGSSSTHYNKTSNCYHQEIHNGCATINKRFQEARQMSGLENFPTKNVPIKPASHLHQRSMNCIKSISKEQTQFGSVYRKPFDGKVHFDKTKWETLIASKKHCAKQSASSMKEQVLNEFRVFHSYKPPIHLIKDYLKNTILSWEMTVQKHTDQKINKTSIERNYSIVASPKNKWLCNSRQFERNKINKVEAQSPNDVHRNNLNGYLFNEENSCLLHKEHEMCHSDAESKDNGFESTDSGIYTTSREHDQNTLNQMNSTEDLYIDDEFCLEMELDSHMQLLCLHDCCIYDENFIEDIQPNRTEETDETNLKTIE